MNRGYRLSAPVALANYYADVRNYANFNQAAQPGIMQRGMEAVRGAGRTVDSAAQTLGAALGGGQRGVNQAALGMAVGNQQAVAQGMRRAVRGARVRGYGAAGLGAAALGGLGYAGYRALKGRGAQEPEAPEYAAYDPRRFMPTGGGQ